MYGLRMCALSNAHSLAWAKKRLVLPAKPGNMQLRSSKHACNAQAEQGAVAYCYPKDPRTQIIGLRPQTSAQLLLNLHPSSLRHQVLRTAPLAQGRSVSSRLFGLHRAHSAGFRV